MTLPSARTEPSPASLLGDELRRIRLTQPGERSRPMSQEQFARILLVGGKGVVSLYETGSRLPSSDVIDRYGRLPGVDLERLHELRSDAQSSRATTADPRAQAAPTVLGMTSDATSPRHRTPQTVIVGAVAFGAGAVAASLVSWIVRDRLQGAEVPP